MTINKDDNQYRVTQCVTQFYLPTHVPMHCGDTEGTSIGTLVQLPWNRLRWDVKADDDLGHHHHEAADNTSDEQRHRGLSY